MSAKDLNSHNEMLEAAGEFFPDAAQDPPCLQDPVNARDEGGKTPLMRTALSGDATAVKSLLAEGADPSLKCNEGSTALFYAASRGRYKAAEVLLNKGGDLSRAETAPEDGAPSDLRLTVDARNNHGETALIEAVLGFPICCPASLGGRG